MVEENQCPKPKQLTGKFELDDCKKKVFDINGIRIKDMQYI
jgi:hypothetical protein